MRHIYLSLISLLLGSSLAGVAAEPASQPNSDKARPSIQAIGEIHGSSQWLTTCEVTVIAVQKVSIGEATSPLLMEDWMAKIPKGQGQGLASIENAIAIPLKGDRWAIALVNRTLVRKAAITAVDTRQGSAFMSPPMPGPGSGGKGALVASPMAEGFTLSIGTGRVFVGVRTAMHGQDPALVPSQEDLRLMASAMSLPTPEGFVAQILSP